MSHSKCHANFITNDNDPKHHNIFCLLVLAHLTCLSWSFFNVPISFSFASIAAMTLFNVSSNEIKFDNAPHATNKHPSVFLCFLECVAFFFLQISSWKSSLLCRWSFMLALITFKIPWTCFFPMTPAFSSWFASYAAFSFKLASLSFFFASPSSVLILTHLIYPLKFSSPKQQNDFMSRIN